MDTTQLCSHDGCTKAMTRPTSALCEMHYSRMMRGQHVRVKDPTVEWRPVPGSDGYEVSARGDVWSSFGLGRELKQMKNPETGYWSVGVRFAGRRITSAVHVMVATAFSGPRPTAGDQVRHLDGDKDNNTAPNLKWGSPSENQMDAVGHGTHYSHFRGVNQCKRGHEFTPENTKVHGGRRHCLTCRAMYRVNRATAKNGENQ